MNYSQDFPLLQGDKDLVYLDSAASSLKPQRVIDAVTDYYTNYSSNIHRGLYPIAERASELYELTRRDIARFINAPSENEIIFTRGATEGMNLIADAFAKEVLDDGDEIVTSIIEHHANFVPWQQLAQKKNCQLRIIDCDDDGNLDIYDSSGNIDLTDIITDATWIFAIQYSSNVLSTTQPLKEIIQAARAIQPKITIIVDAAQSVPHMNVDVQELDCDFLVASGHKMCGPTGIGFVWGRKKLLDAMPPYQYGGDMITRVGLSSSDFAEVPHRFEAGTPHIAGVIGLSAAIAYLTEKNVHKIHDHETRLAQLFIDKLKDTFSENVTILGEKARHRSGGIVAFEIDGCHSHDVAGYLGENNVAVRAGHHCAMPLHDRLKIHSSTRASFYLYNTEKDVQICIKHLKDAYSLLKK